MCAKQTQISDNTFMLAVGYLTLLAVTLLGFNLLTPGIQKVVGLGLLVSFGVIYALPPQETTPAAKTNAYFVAQTVIVSILIAIQPQWGVFPMLFFILSAQAMMVFPERVGYFWVGAFTLLTGLIFFLTGDPLEAFLTLLPFSAGYWFFAAFARSLATAEEARKESQRLLNELQVAHRQLQDYAGRVEELAVSEERNRLAREMHDTLGHRLTVASVQLEGAQRLILDDPDRATQMVETVREQVREALSELRSTVATLREPLQTDLSLWNALPRLVAPFDKATGLDVELTLPPEEFALPNAHRLTIYRAVQEALTNVQRHARAQRVWVNLSHKGDALQLVVSDDGIGLPTHLDENRFGLRGLRERVAQLGGKLELGNRDAGGAQLRICLPLTIDGEKV
ncbi:MAG: sensor histidine kinase [Anaerolineae bacterium]|nr:sensor histidine kinase [Anaerolineae bacterium]